MKESENIGQKSGEGDFVITGGDGSYFRFGSGQAEEVKGIIRRSSGSWRRIRTKVIQMNVLVGVSRELGLGGVVDQKCGKEASLEEIERGADFLREIYTSMQEEEADSNS
jgi:hypothetical protein